MKYRDACTREYDSADLEMAPMTHAWVRQRTEQWF